jgi:eukaryotic-like serine/threonine-protein kinase
MNDYASSPGDWVGRLIDRRFPLLEWLGSAESGELFRTELPGQNTPGQKNQKAAIRLVPADIEGAQAQFDDWAQAEGLSHPHILRILESGHGRIGESEMLYVVMEFPEETLAQVLPGRALTAGEANDLLPPVLDALAYLHAKGLVHGHLNPTNIMVVGDRLKLSSDKLQQSGRLRKLQGGLRAYDAPEIAQGNLSPASDVWSLGVTLVEALTQLPPMRSSTPGGDPSVPKFMPEPFAEIARRCLRIDPAHRASLAEIEAIFRTPATRSTTAPVPQPRPAAVSPAAAAFKAPSAPRPTPPEPRAAKVEQAAFPFDQAQPSRRALRSVEDEEDEPRFKLSPPLIIGIVAVIVVLIAALLVRSHKAQPAPDVQSTALPAATPAPPTPAPTHNPAKPASGKGAVAERVMPAVPAKADQTIRGKISVKVRLWVDRNGAVYRSAIDFNGRSSYFANLALEAAKKWHFQPAHGNGQALPSIWVLRFDFRKGKTDVTPVEVNP